MPLQEWATAVGLFIGFCLVVGIPGIAILTHHQRKMAELMRKNQPPELNDQVLERLDAMQRQMNGMRDRQNEILLQVHDRPQFSSPPPIGARPTRSTCASPSSNCHMR